MKIDKRQQEFADLWLKPDGTDYTEACKDAVTWLRSACTFDGICDLAYAWDKCRHADWMLWMLQRMERPKTTEKQLREFGERFLEYLQQQGTRMNSSYIISVKNVLSNRHLFTTVNEDFTDFTDTVASYLIDTQYDPNEPLLADTLRKHVHNPWK